MRLIVLPAVLLLGCEQVPSSGKVFQPVAVAQPTSPAPRAAEVDGTEPLVPGEAPPADDADAPPEVAAEDLLARMVGLTPAEVTHPEPEPVVDSAPPIPVPVQIPAWDPSAPPPEASSWGVRVLSTIVDMQPPRAVIALANGEEVVVQPGTMLPEARLVVMAVGRDQVQLAHVAPNGPYATVDTVTVAPLLPTR